MNEAVDTMIRRSRSKRSELWRYVLVEYWATVEVRCGKKMRKVVPPRNLLQASLGHGGMGCDRFGAKPKALLMHKEVEPIDSRFSWIAKQLKNNGSLMAVRRAGELAHDLGLRLVDTENLVLRHAESLISGALPISVKSAMRKDKNKKLADWYDANRNVESVEVTNDADVDEFVRMSLKLFEPERAPRSVWNPVSVVKEAVGMALGPLSPAGDVFSSIRDVNMEKVDPEVLIAKMGGSGAMRRINYCANMLGADRAKGVILGNYTLHLPSSGVCPTNHRVLLDHCLVAALRSKVIPIEITDLELQYKVTQLCYSVEKNMLNNTYWSPQLRY
jgi:hypothetical protein